MKRTLSLLLSITVICSISCFSQESKNKDFHFWKYVENISGSRKGKITMDIYMFTYKRKLTNPYGEAIVCMLHKNGGKWWSEQAKKKFSESIVAENRYAKIVILKDTSLLIDYNKWAFVVDKKYLQPAKMQEEGDYNPDDPTGERSKNTIFYEVPKGKKYEAILYEQKAGSNVWIELERKELISGENKETIKDWQEELMKKKLQENP